MGARTNYLVTCSCLPLAASSEVPVYAVSTQGSREFTDVSLSSMEYSRVKEWKCLCSPGLLQIRVCQLVKKWGNGDALCQEGFIVLFERYWVHAVIALLECKRSSSKCFLKQC